MTIRTHAPNNTEGESGSARRSIIDVLLRKRTAQADDIEKEIPSNPAFSYDSSRKPKPKAPQPIIPGPSLEEIGELRVKIPTASRQIDGDNVPNEGTTAIKVGERSQRIEGLPNEFSEAISTGNPELVRRFMIENEQHLPGFINQPDKYGVPPFINAVNKTIVYGLDTEIVQLVGGVEGMDPFVTAGDQSSFDIATKKGRKDIALIVKELQDKHIESHGAKTHEATGRIILRGEGKTVVVDGVSEVIFTDKQA